MKYLYFDLKLFLILTFSFIIMTVIGTLSHECGHYAVAKYFGYDARIDYQSTHIEGHKALNKLLEIEKKFTKEIRNNIKFPEKEYYEKSLIKYKEEGILILLGGPLQTMITGTIGLIFLIIYRKKVFSSNKTSFAGWLLVFCSLFWLRQSANSVLWTLAYLFTGEKSMRGDEMRLTRYFNMNIWTIHGITAIIGFIVLFIVIRMLPKNQVLTFLAAGLVGGISGYYLWLIQFGKYILP